MDESYLDTHICLGCRQTIVGLDAYIQHKKYDCTVLKSKDLPKNSITDSPLLMQKNTSDVHFGCDDFASVVASSLPDSGEFRDITQPSSSFAPLTPTWFEVVPSSANNGQPSATEIVPASTTVSTSGQSSADLVDNIVLLTTQNCSFFNSLQLKSKSTGGQPQPEDKFKSIERVTLPDFSANKEMGCVSPFLHQSKQLEHLCALTSPELKIEADLFNTEASIADQQKNGQNGHLDLYGRTKVLEESLTYCWKSSVPESNNEFNQLKSSDSSALPERKEDGTEMSYSFDHSKALRIAYMFNSLELESDSDDFMPSDADDLLNFSDMDDEQNGFNHSHGDGKVIRERGVLGGKLESYKHSDVCSRSQGKVLRLRKEHSVHEKNSSKDETRTGKLIATKWRPGERPAVLPRYHPHTSRGKWQGPEGEDVEEEEQDEQDEETDVEERSEKCTDMEAKKSSRGKQLTELNCQKQETVRCQTPKDGKTQETCKKLGKKVKEKPMCKSCNKTFVNHQSLAHHLKTALHRKRSQLQALGSESEQNQSVHVKLECPLCDKVFHSKYSFARHLLTPMHARRAQYNEKYKLIASTGLEAGVHLLMQRLQPFQCRICNFHTSVVEELMTHLKTSEHIERVITLRGPFICMRCQYACQNNDDMIAHVSSVEHINVVESSFQPCVLKEKRCKITCPDCDMVINSTSQLAKHQKTCQTTDFSAKNKKQGDQLEPLKCAHCGAAFLTRLNLALHVRRIHRKEKPFQCRVCDKVFGDDSALKLHRLSNHHIDAVKTSFTKEEAIEDPMKVEDGSELNMQMHKSKQCDCISDTLSDIITHSVSHVPSDCAICGLRFAKPLDHDKHMTSRQHRKKEEELKVSSGDSLICDKCQRKFYTIRSLKLHEMNHQYANGKMPKNNGSGPDDIEVRCRKLIRESSKLPNRKIECPECGKFLTKIGILPHLRAHAGVFPFQCTYCSKKFVDGNIMKRHLKVHLGIRSYSCKFCPREFDRRLTLDTHLMREHKDSAGIVASHLCNICGHKFLQLNQLNAHLKFHDKTVRCPYPGCLLTFRYQSEMLIHMQVHTKETRFLCDECGYAGKTKTQLSRHRRVHTGERRYKCSHCSYGAKHIANLTRHERVHTGNKPYQCPYCKYSCNTQENLRKHILKTKRHAGKPVYPCPKCDFGCNSASEFQNHMEVVHSVPRTHLPSMVAGLYRRETDTQPTQKTTVDQCLNVLVT